MSRNVSVAPDTIGALAEVITGGSAAGPRDAPSYGPYKKGYELVEFFNDFGADDTYDSNFGSRLGYTRERIEWLNGSPEMGHLIEEAVNPRRFLGQDTVSPEAAVDYLNDYLRYEGYQLVRVGDAYRLRPRGGKLVQRGRPSVRLPEERREFIEEHLTKAEERLKAGDFTGAITSARSLVEEVLRQVEAFLYPEPPSYDGDLLKLNKRVYRKLNLDPSAEGLNDAARQVLSGLIAVVSGIAPMRNEVGDAHAFEYRPYRHHAELAVNAARTFAGFLSATLDYQIEHGFISESTDPDT